MTKKPLFSFKNKHRKKIAILVVGVLVVLWNFIAVPVAATHGITLPPVTLAHLQAAGSFLLGF